MVTIRTGSYGEYYGSDYNSSDYLTEEQKKVNATYIYNYLLASGFSINSICAVLGNMDRESTLNPGCWESHSVGNLFGGYGLVQWTPASNYINWVNALGSGEDPSNIDNNLGRIIYERSNGLQYYPTTDYPETFDEFCQSTKTLDYLTMAFLKNYERAGVEAIGERIESANKWYQYLTGETPPSGGGSDTGTITTKKKKGFNFILFGRRRRIYG